MKEFKKVQFESKTLALADVIEALEQARVTVPDKAKLYFIRGYGEKANFTIEAEWEAYETSSRIA